MKVFLSWSEERSKSVATALYEWLKLVVQACDPWMSSVDLHSGDRWILKIWEELDAGSIGVVCLTPENQDSQWLNYEAGALAKKLEGSIVVPYLFGMQPSDVTGPLGHLQGRIADKEDTYRLVETINEATGERSLKVDTLREAFETYWPRLETKLKAIPATVQTAPPKRGQIEMIEEILDLVRARERREKENEARGTPVFNLGLPTNWPGMSPALLAYLSQTPSSSAPSLGTAAPFQSTGETRGTPSTGPKERPKK